MKPNRVRLSWNFGGDASTMMVLFPSKVAKSCPPASLPDQRIYFNIIDEISEVVLDEITTEIEKRVAYRIEGFKKLLVMIETGQEPASAVLSVLSKC